MGCYSSKEYNIEYFENSSKKKYEGSMLFNKKNGFGIEYSLNGKKIYEGLFKDNKKEGNGIYYNEYESVIYDGEF